MSYQVLYRKYRPRDFSEVVGQDHIVSVIRRQVETGRLAHAYLFSGPRGIGKTTVARIIAKAVNCRHAQDLPARARYVESDELVPIPCNKCESCDVFNSGQALNLIEIDAASNRGIDEIRELRDMIKFAPVAGGKKVYIIDEVHQLTKEAFNALLKTLEEPPPHAIFVLATTELDKVPATIVSRTQHFDFRRPRQEIIRERLMTIAGKESLELERDAAETIAFVAEGSVRDAESMLGKVLAVAEGAISREEVENILGIPKREALRQLFAFIGNKNLKGALALINHLYHDGYEMEYLTKMLMAFFRDTLVTKLGPDSRAVSVSNLLPESENLAVHLQAYSAKDLADAILHLIEALASSKRTPIPQLPLELAVISIVSQSKFEKPTT